jgi:hypothetical protein
LIVRALERSRPSGFSTTTRAPVAQPDEPSFLGYCRKEARGDRQVVDGPRGLAERLAQLGERCIRAVIAIDELEFRLQAIECGRIGRGIVRREAFAQPYEQGVPRHAATGDADDSVRQTVPSFEILERRQDLLEGQIAGDAEDHQRIRIVAVHQCLLPQSVGICLIHVRQRRPPTGHRAM